MFACAMIVQHSSLITFKQYELLHKLGFIYHHDIMPMMSKLKLLTTTIHAINILALRVKCHVVFLQF